MTFKEWTEKLVTRAQRGLTFEETMEEIGEPPPYLPPTAVLKPGEVSVFRCYCVRKGGYGFQQHPELDFATLEVALNYAQNNHKKWAYINEVVTSDPGGDHVVKKYGLYTDWVVTPI